MINTLDFPTGTVSPFASPYASLPAGWVKCDGALYDGTLDAYAPLFNVISITYGGSGTSFRVPNLGQRIIVGGSPGVWYGQSSVALTPSQCGIPSHDHDVTETSHNHSVTDNNHYHNVRYGSAIITTKGANTNQDFNQGSSFDNPAWRGDGMEVLTSGIDGTNTNLSYGAGYIENGVYYKGTGLSNDTTNGAAHENRMPYVATQYLIKL